MRRTVSHRSFVRAALVVSALATAVSYALGGATAAVGMLIGIVFTTFSLLATWMLIKVVSPAAENRGTPGVLVALLFLFKLPLLAISVVVVVKLGIASLAAFLAGIILVYSALIWRVQTLPQLPDRSE